MEYNDDIEKLLQQYGRQKQIASHVRHLAHVQARRRTWVACTLLVLLGSVGIVRMLSTSQTSEQTLVAQQVRPTAGNTVPAVDVATVNVEPRLMTATTRHYDNQTAMIEIPDSPLPSTVEESPLVAKLPQEDTAVHAPDVLSEPIPETTLVDVFHPEIGMPSEPIIQPSNQAIKHSNNLHFISSVTASATPSYGTGYAGDASANTESTTSLALTPRCTFTADVGAAFTVAGNERRHFDIGLSLGGHYQQGELLNVVHNQMMGVDGFLSDVIITQTEGTYSTFSLYASLPLTYSIAPRDSKSVGWSLSVTPARSIALSHMLGGIELNPWRLTLGVGILFPKKYLHRVSLVANLLPLYISYPIHEIGIEIGF